MRSRSSSTGTRSCDTGGRASITVAPERNVIVGATFVGQDATDLVHAATVAIVGEVPLQRLRHATPVFPAPSESRLELLKDVGVGRAGG